VRGTLPGFTYQLGNLISTPAATIEALVAEKFKTANGSPNYALTLAVLALIVFVLVFFFTAIGRTEYTELEFKRETITGE
jgi:SHS family lactate transporter-like MFS transporter